MAALFAPSSEDEAEPIVELPDMDDALDLAILEIEAATADEPAENVLEIEVVAADVPAEPPVPPVPPRTWHENARGHPAVVISWVHSRERRSRNVSLI